MEPEIPPPFSVFLGTSMRATFHSKFSDGDWMEEVSSIINSQSGKFLKIHLEMERVDLWQLL